MTACKKCNYAARSKDLLGKHIKSNHGDSNRQHVNLDEIIELTCRLCTHESETQEEMENHMKNTHKKVTLLSCDLCHFTVDTKENMDRHIQTIHMTAKVDIKTKEQIVLSCDLCDYKCSLNIKLKKHKLAKHKGATFGCDTCPFTANILNDVWAHRQTKHPETLPVFLPQTNSVQEMGIPYIAEQNMRLLAEMEKLKEDLKGAFEELTDIIETNLTTVKHEMAVNNKDVNSAITRLHNVIETNQSKNSNKSEQPQQKEALPTPAPPPQTANVKKPAAKPHNTEYQRRMKVLYVADSIGGKVEFPEVEAQVQCTIKTAKAYSSVHDRAAIWPKQNFSDIVRQELGNKEYDSLVMSSPTVDITNLDSSKLKHSDDTAGYQHYVLTSCQNMFTTAQRALEEHPNLKKVVIMEHAPRYDEKDIDPLGLKPELSKYANSVYNQLWLDSHLKNKISVGRHSLNEISDESYDDIFRNPKSGRHDGVHLYGQTGCTDYTNSVMTILMLAKSEQNLGVGKTGNHSNCPQAKYQENAIQTQNSFSVFDSNSENC